MSYRLGIDFGTSRTVGFLAGPDHRIRPLLFDGAPFLPSAVCATADGGLVVGHEALANAPIWPERFEPAPKRRVIERSVPLGRFEYPVSALIGAVLHRITRLATATAGRQPAEVVCTCPASWGEARRGVLAEAARIAGLGAVRLIDEPSAAAAAVFAGAGAGVPPGACVVVYDLGAGTCGVSAIRRTATGFTVLASEELTDAGGLDLDAAIITYLGNSYAARDRSAWERLVTPRTAADVRQRLRLRADVQTAKDLLARFDQVRMRIPLLDLEIVLSREEVERLALPILERTVAATDLLVHGLDLDPARFGGIFLAGGGSQLPLVSELLQQAIGVPPTVLPEPDLVVARGSLLVPAAPDASAGPASAPGASAPGASAGPASARGPGSTAGHPSPPPGMLALPAAGPPQRSAGRIGRRARASRQVVVTLAAMVAVLLLAVVGGAAAVISDLTGRSGRSGSATVAREPRIPGQIDQPGAASSPSSPSPPSQSASPDPAESSSERSSRGPTPTPRTSGRVGPPTQQPPGGSSTGSCVTSGQVKVTVPNVPDTICVTTAVSLLISLTTGPPSSSDAGLVRCKFYGTDSAALCLMYATGTAWLESSGEVPWTMKIIVTA